MKKLIGALVLGASASLCAQTPALTYVALRTTSEHPPAPVEGVVTLTTPSGAWVKIRAIDIDYDRTAAYPKTVVVRAETATTMSDKTSGRDYLNLTFSRRFVATAWLTDVDYAVMRSGFAAYVDPRQRASTGPTAIIRAKCAKDWPDDYVMREYCEERQTEALAKLGGGK